MQQADFHRGVLRRSFAARARKHLHRARKSESHRRPAVRIHAGFRARIGIITAATTWAKRATRGAAQMRILDIKPERGFHDLTLLASPSATRRSAPWPGRRHRQGPIRHRLHSNFAQHLLLQPRHRANRPVHRARRFAAREVSRQPDGDLRAADPLLRGRTARDTGRPCPRNALRGRPGAAHAHARPDRVTRGALSPGASPLRARINLIDSKGAHAD